MRFSFIRVIIFMKPFEWHHIGGDIDIALSDKHRFSTDSVLLSHFSAPKKTDVVAELCSGCGIVSLLWFRSKQLSPKCVYTLDIDPEAVLLTSKAIEKNKLQENITAFCGDLKNPPKEFLPNFFDMVVCNPPYFPTPKKADLNSTVARHEISSSIEDVCSSAAKMLRFGGRLCVSWRPSRLSALFASMRANKIEPKRMQPVCSKPDEPPFLMLIEGRLGAGEELSVLPNIVLYNNDRTLTEQYKQIYNI